MIQVFKVLSLLSKKESWDSKSGVLIPWLELLPYTSDVPGHIPGLLFYLPIFYS